MFTTKQPIIMFDFEGIDGAGKSSLIAEVERKLNVYLDSAMGPIMRVITRRLPTEDVPLGKEIRAAVKAGTLSTKNEVLALTLNRAQLAEELRQIATNGHERNTIVLMDRWAATCEAYQGTDEPLISREIADLQKRFVGLYPTQTFYVDIDPEVAKKRMLATRPALDPNEVDTERQGHIRSMYQHLAKQRSWVTLNGEYPLDRLSQIVVEHIYEQLKQFKKEDI